MPITLCMKQPKGAPLVEAFIRSDQDLVITFDGVPRIGIILDEDTPQDPTLVIWTGEGGDGDGISFALGEIDLDDEAAVLAVVRRAG